MRRFVIALAAGTLMSGAAFAADMPVKAPLAPAPMVVDWSGWYVGGTFGWVDQHHHWAFDPALPASPNQVFDLSRSGAMGGFVSGYQKQFGQFVLGLESAYNWFGDAFANHPGYGVGAGFAEARLRSVWTAGVRAGWAASPAWLFYLNGGYANGSVQTQNISTAGVVNANFDTTRNHSGWYGGGGVDYRIWQNFIVGLEYQRIELDSRLHIPVGGVAVTNNHDVKPTADLVRARITVLFH